MTPAERRRQYDALTPEERYAADRAAMDDIFAYDSSDDARMPPPRTPEQEAAIEADAQFLREKVARDRAWAAREAEENP